MNDPKLMTQLIKLREQLGDINGSIRILSDCMEKCPEQYPRNMWFNEFIKVMREKVEDARASLSEDEAWKGQEKDEKSERACHATELWIRFLEKQFPGDQREIMTLEQARDDLATRMAQLSKECMNIAERLGINLL